MKIASMCARCADILTFFVNLYAINGLEEVSEYINTCLPHMTSETHMLIVGDASRNAEREISHEEAQKFADKFRCPYLECCVKTGEGIDEIKECWAEMLHDAILANDPKVLALDAQIQLLTAERQQILSKAESKSGQPLGERAAHMRVINRAQRAERNLNSLFQLCSDECRSEVRDMKAV